MAAVAWRLALCFLRTIGRLRRTVVGNDTEELSGVA